MGTGPIDTVKIDVWPEKSIGQTLYDMFVPTYISKMQMAKYKSYGSNWTYLAANLARGLSIQEIGILLYIELHGLNRPNLVNRLVGSIGVYMRNEFRGEVAVKHPFESRE